MSKVRPGGHLWPLNTFIVALNSKSIDLLIELVIFNQGKIIIVNLILIQSIRLSA